MSVEKVCRYVRLSLKVLGKDLRCVRRGVLRLREFDVV